MGAVGKVYKSLHRRRTVRTRVLEESLSKTGPEGHASGRESRKSKQGNAYTGLRLQSGTLLEARDFSREFFTVEEKVSKDGNMMATVRIGASTGEFNAVFFSKSYEAYSSLLKVDTEICLYGKYVYDKYGMTFSVKEAYPISDDTYYILSQDYKEELFIPFRKKCGCQLYLMNDTGKLVNTEAYYSSEISSISGVRVIPKI